MVSQVADLGRVEDVDSEDLDSGADSSGGESYEDYSDDIDPSNLDETNPSGMPIVAVTGLPMFYEQHLKTATANATIYASMQH
jgi:hypothetical protein